jgi:hypothetical protein
MLLPAHQKMVHFQRQIAVCYQRWRLNRLRAPARLDLDEPGLMSLAGTQGHQA